MALLRGLALFISGVALGSAGVFVYDRCYDELERLIYPAEATQRKVLYYRDPTGAPYWSATPKKNASGRDYLPVYEDEEKLGLGADSAGGPATQ